MNKKKFLITFIITALIGSLVGIITALFYKKPKIKKIIASKNFFKKLNLKNK